jgi:glycosyltransferase involved in cell wall biosynthesis
MKIYAEVLPTTLGRVVYRINKNLKQFAPPWAEFTKDPTQADVQILDVIGKGSLEFIKNDNLIMFQHCYLTTETSDPAFWYPIFSSAKLVASYIDIPKLLGRDDFNFLRTPWGVDPNSFFSLGPVHKHFDVLSTGYVSSTESIQEAYNAVVRLGGHMVNIGHNFKFGRGFSHAENISDAELRKLYERSRYVIGLRKMEGYELPILEGLLCGTRGICYNSDHYTHWFGDLVEYIEEDPLSLCGVEYSKVVEDQIYNIISEPYREVTKEEKELVINKFSWENIYKRIWKELEKIL